MLQGRDSGPTLVGQDIYEISSTPKGKIGDRLVINDRVFHYALAGAALVAGKLCESAAFGGSSATIQTNLVTATASAVGTKTFYATLTTDAALVNQYAEGYAYVYDSTGAGQTYKIRSHAAIGAGGAGTFTLYDDIIVATVAGASKAGLHANLWRKIKTSAVTTPVGVPVGVPLIAVTDAYYCWIQTWGPVCVLKDGTSALNTAALRGVTAAGSVGIQVAAASSVVNPEIGFSMDTGADTKYGLVYLRIAA